ncbi:transposase [Lebetimonas sp. JH292]|uniref:transposase n=1 Tax=Lebetimonas sp. JH292 TaxID=990068 RepID=UPI0004647FF7
MLKAEIEEFVENNDISKNGYYSKTVRSDSGEIRLNIPRDRKSEFEPQIVKKGQRTISRTEDEIIAMYARGMSLRDIEKQVKEMYDVEMSDSLISRIVDKITPGII